MKSCFDAFRLLTILPLPASGRPPGPAMLYWFPVVGAALGLVLAGVDPVMSRYIGVMSPILLVALWLFLTRALHVDGLGDTFDAMASVADRARRLEILRDPHIGTVGASVVALVLIAKVAALSGTWGHARSMALLTAPAIARWPIVMACAIFPYARKEGLGAAFIGHAGWTHVGFTTGLALVSMVLVPLNMIPWILGSAVLAGLGTAFMANRSFGGITGDVLGAMVEIGECAVLMVWSCQR